ncbi:MULTISPECIES: MarR family winged helix-turn-helix transcriptional regulator [Sphingomonadales]|uniref:Putative HTH-type transcriptional regulator YusO n=1 Tax=Edaphosphingomonas haloaromaticamans TaxID=653954 RepID=A0A1S1HJ23_9SPHN|nr:MULTISPECIES: MarR family transcriptional regulator [Sphingomonas]AGH49697.1 transcription regulator protein [Sphingomonas sp. MM-1]MDX3884160.1 MarR family transcriptional regulator [Sphingomonas sp.]OHT22274.1 putative HTH-type transcriptional regulator YusO [Sphingomonas haloaromaticamans]
MTVARDAVSAGLRDFYLRTHRLLDGLMKDTGASFARARLLGYIHKEGPVRSTDIAESMAYAPRTVTVAIDALEREGLVRRDQDPADRRAKYISITDAGLAALCAAEPTKQRFVDSLYRALTDEEALQLARLIGKLNDRLEEIQAECAAEQAGSAG